MQWQSSSSYNHKLQQILQQVQSEQLDNILQHKYVDYDTNTTPKWADAMRLESNARILLQ